MICLNCLEKIVIKRNILNLFSFRKEYICMNCFKKICFEPNYINLPINKYDFVIYYLVKDTKDFKYASLTNEFNRIYKKIKELDLFILTTNRYYMSENNYIFFEQLAKHLEKNICILCYELID